MKICQSPLPNNLNDFENCKKPSKRNATAPPKSNLKRCQPCPRPHNKYIHQILSSSVSYKDMLGRVLSKKEEFIPRANTPRKYFEKEFPCPRPHK